MVRKLSKWKTVSSKTTYTSDDFVVKHDKVILPDGAKESIEYIEKNDFVLVIPVKNSLFYFVEQYRYAAGKKMIEFPQGHPNEKEAKEKAALRELAEETGLQAQKIAFLGKIDMGKGTTKQVCHVFVAKDFLESEQNLDVAEQDLCVLEVAESEMKDMIAKGDITDSATLAAYMLYTASL